MPDKDALGFPWQDRSRNVHLPGGASYFLPVYTTCHGILFGTCAFSRFSKVEGIFVKLSTRTFYFVKYFIVSDCMYFMVSPGQKLESCRHFMAAFDLHFKYARCHDRALAMIKLILNLFLPLYLYLILVVWKFLKIRIQVSFAFSLQAFSFYVQFACLIKLWLCRCQLNNKLSII